MAKFRQIWSHCLLYEVIFTRGSNGHWLSIDKPYCIFFAKLETSHGDVWWRVHKHKIWGPLRSRISVSIDKIFVNYKRKCSIFTREIFLVECARISEMRWRGKKNLKRDNKRIQKFLSGWIFISRIWSWKVTNKLF